MTGSFVIEALAPHHERANFSCGVDVLDRYLQTQASQDMRRRVSNCFVAVLQDSPAIAGFYTLAAASIPFGEIPLEMAKRLPRYPVLPAVLIGRLAVDRTFAKRSLGSALLYDAVLRTGRADPAAFALIVDAKDDNAAGFYRQFGFVGLVSRPMSFFLPMATAMKLISR